MGPNPRRTRHVVPTDRSRRTCVCARRERGAARLSRLHRRSPMARRGSERRGRPHEHASGLGRRRLPAQGILRSLRRPRHPGLARLHVRLRHGARQPFLSKQCDGRGDGASEAPAAPSEPRLVVWEQRGGQSLGILGLAGDVQLARTGQCACGPGRDGDVRRVVVRRGERSQRRVLPPHLPHLGERCRRCPRVGHLVWQGAVGLLQPSRRTICQRIRTAKPASSDNASRGGHPHIPRRGPAVPPTEQDGLARAWV